MNESSEGGKRFYGKYKGTVTINTDPELRGRIICLVPAVLGPTPSGWCEPCAPLAGPTGPPMGVYMVPPPGAGVWVEFEGGDPEKPIWSGCRFAPGNVPPLALANPPDPNICIQSLLQNMIMVSDMPPSPLTGGIILKSTLGAMIVVNDSGIYISNGKGAMITLIGTAIDFNVGALTILK
ncbi:MAG TPA: phage baseplate assembly protein V [Blastocatellia bacterium]|nr:phage baseplate assembly protein V [Blastocatellia bacterium]